MNQIIYIYIKDDFFCGLIFLARQGTSRRKKTRQAVACFLFLSGSPCGARAWKILTPLCGLSKRPATAFRRILQQATDILCSIPQWQ